MKLLRVKSVEKVKKIIYAEFEGINRVETITITECLNRVLADDIFSPECLPPFSRSSVDGYAVRACETYGASESMPAMLELDGEINMGELAGQVITGHTKYIPTGGMLPEGADSIVMIEHTEKLGEQILIYKQVSPGQNVIKAGDDVKKGEIILRKGTVLREAELGALAALGIYSLPIIAKPIVGILSTGNELVKYTKKELKDGEIRDINALTLASISKKYGTEVLMGEILKDNYELIISKAREMLEKVDVLLLSGGSSVGEHDYTWRVLRELSDDNILVEGISIKPGKPTLIAKKGNKAIMGLPGHPVSAYMIYDCFGEIIVNQLAGKREPVLKKTIKALLTKNVPSSGGRTDWIRVELHQDEECICATPVFGKSGLITTLVKSHGYIEIPPLKEGVEKGSWVDVILRS